MKLSKNKLIVLILILLSTTLVGGTAYLTSTYLPEIIQKSESKDLDVPEPAAANSNASDPENREADSADDTTDKRGTTTTPAPTSSNPQPSPSPSPQPKTAQQCYLWRHEVKYSTTYAGKTDYYTETTTQYDYKEPQASPSMQGSGTKIISTRLLEKKTVSDVGKCG